MLHLSPVNAVETCYYRLMLFFPRQTLGFEQIQRLRCITAFTVLFIPWSPLNPSADMFKGLLLFFLLFQTLASYTDTPQPKSCMRSWSPTFTSWVSSFSARTWVAPSTSSSSFSCKCLPGLFVYCVFLFSIELQTMHVYCMCHSSED